MNGTKQKRSRMNEDEERGARCGLLSGKQSTLHRRCIMAIIRSLNKILNAAYLSEKK